VEALANGDVVGPGLGGNAQIALREGFELNCGSAGKIPVILHDGTPFWHFSGDQLVSILDLNHTNF
jgi:hypothetical protein